ncbi:O-antigen ligase [Dyella sp. SG562]|uniref:O-antigen ligase family protein n=1 Tax=Dyella sp. SG562 TaxID=2587017 RepID=UPI00142469FF|nr:O-antigen ligase family protein [Dyella sp. SG562]NII73597.1 O-antigen ligase [Dyella sp. SG562]
MPVLPALKAALRSPLLPFWLVIALLPFGRSSELGTFLCLLGVVLLFARHPRALGEHAGARLLLWLLGAYIGAALLSCFGAVAPGKSWSTVAALLRYVPLGLYACFAIRRAGKLDALYVAVAAVLAVWVLDAWVQALTGWSLGGHAEQERVSGIFGADNLKLGPALAVLAPFALWAARWRRGRLGLVLAALALLGPVLLSGSRASWLTYALVVLAFAWREAGSARRFVLICCAGTLVAAAAGGLAWKTSERFHARMEKTLLAFRASDHAVDMALSGRLDIWRTSWWMFEAHPLNGVGVRGYRYAYRQVAPPDDHFVATGENCGAGEGACHAHQVVLEVLSETGLAGLALWLAGAVLAIRRWHAAGAAARARAFPATVALGVMLFPLNTHLAFYSAWWGLLFAWVLGLWCASLYVAAEDADGA